MESTSKRKRKLPNRSQELNEEDTFSPKTDSTTKPHRTNPSDLSDPVAEEDDINIDREIEQLVSGSKRTKPTKSKGKGDGQPAKKKARKLVIESDGENDDYLAEEGVPEEKEGTDDDYHSSEEEKLKTSKGKTKASATRGTKRKAKAAPANSRPALERRTSVEPLPSKKRVKLTLKLDDSLVDGDAASTPDTYDKPSPAPLKYDSPAPQVKKVKLPAIKKTKLPGGPTGSATPTSATPAPPKPKLPLDIGVGSKADTRKSQAATADLDLSNKSVYQELFKTGSDGNTPRTGLNRRTKEEERRKELHKLKEEYLAKRATEEAHSFDLQAQQDKIAKFEDKLKYYRSVALYPNCIAAKWKELYDKEKRNNWNGMSEGRYNRREEGEVK